VVTAVTSGAPLTTDIIGHMEITAVYLAIIPMQPSTTGVYVLASGYPVSDAVFATRHKAGVTQIFAYIGAPEAEVIAIHLLVEPHYIAVEHSLYRAVSAAEVFATRRAAIAEYFILVSLIYKL
jgi:hypothetical protein